MPYDSLKFKIMHDIDATQKALIKKGVITQEELDDEKKQK